MKLKIVVIVFIMVVPILGCEKSYLTSVPDDLKGVWTASEGRYAGCTLSLSADLIVFGSSSGNMDTNHIKRVTENKGVNAVQYSIIYKNEDGQNYKITLKYYNTKRIIMLEHDTDTKWHKES